jgi:hypothetical protein
MKEGESQGNQNGLDHLGYWNPESLADLAAKNAWNPGTILAGKTQMEDIRRVIC